MTDDVVLDRTSYAKVSLKFVASVDAVKRHRREHLLMGQCVLGECKQQHKAVDYISFLKNVDRYNPKEKCFT